MAPLDRVFSPRLHGLFVRHLRRRLPEGKNAEGGRMQVRPGESDIPQQVVVEFHHGPFSSVASGA